MSSPEEEIPDAQSTVSTQSYAQYGSDNPKLHLLITCFGTLIDKHLLIEATFHCFIY